MNIRPKLNPITERVLLLRDAGVVKRSHTCRTLMDRNVAEHSHGVAMLLITLHQFSSFKCMPSSYLLAAALAHDLSEIATGDTPAPVKRANPDLKRMLNAISSEWEEKNDMRFPLNEEEQHLLLWCDRMDFALYALEEVTMGNRYFEEYLARITDWLSEMPLPHIHGDTRAAENLYKGVMAAVSYSLSHSTFGSIL